jgi:hypothetical protein
MSKMATLRRGEGGCHEFRSEIATMGRREGMG